MSVSISFVGRVGTDAETVNFSNATYIKFSVAVDEIIKKEQKTRWIGVMGNSDQYKNMAQYIKKGKLVVIRGIERVSTYTTKSGDVGIDTTVWADNIEFVPGSQKQIDSNSDNDEKNAQMVVTGMSNHASEAGSAKNQGTIDDVQSQDYGTSDDDLPF